MPWSNNYTSTISTALATLCPPAVVEVTDNVRYRGSWSGVRAARTNLFPTNRTECDLDVTLSTREDAATQPHLLLWGDAKIVRRLAGITVI
jgi:hypothetical protein